jgi:NAD-dependent DNA ligase
MEKIKNDIIANPIKTLEKLSKKQIVEFLEHCDIAFFNTGSTLVSDDIYDIVKNHLKKIDPKNSYFKRVGADEEHKAQLPYWLGSQDKIKDDEKEINKWLTKYSKPKKYVISEKLDGISCLIYYINDDIKVYTRGNGTEGQDISHIIPYISNFPKLKLKKMAVRGELIISRENWEKIKSIGSNARNVVAGAIHSKIINNDIMKHIEFVAYDLLFPRLSLSESYKLLLSHSIKTVKYIEVVDVSLEILSNLLQKWRKESLYDIDGIVIVHDEVHNLISGKNPKYSFAFKSILTHEQAEVIVTDIEWNVSKDRYLKPIIKFNEVVISGVKIKQATGFNAKYIESNKIGPGSRIVIIRSGDVIPHVIKVLTPSASGLPKMPENDYIWNDTNIDIILSDDKKNREQDIKTFMYFMKTLNVPHIGEGIITKIYDSGFDTLSKIINVKESDLLKIEGFKEKNANKIFTSLNDIKKVECEDLLNASNILGRGFGEKKIKAIFNKYPYLISDRKKALKLTISDLKLIEGIADTSAEQFITNLPKFYVLYDELGIKCVHKTDALIHKTSVNANFKDKKFVFSGFRNKDWEKIIEDNGGGVTTVISKNTSYLVVKNIDDTSSKIEKAKEYGVSILSVEDFQKLL